MGAGAAFARRLSSVSGSPTGIVPFAPLPPADSPELETFENAENSFPQQEAPAGTSSRAAEQPEPRQGVSATTLLARRTLEEMSSVGKGIGLYLHGIIFRGQIIWQKSVLDKIKANLDVLNFVERFQPQFAPSRRELLEELDMWQDTMQRVTQEQQALLLSRQQPPDLLSSPSQTADASGSAVPQSPGSQQIQPETMRGESPSYQQLPQDMPFRFGEPGGFVALSDEEKPGQPTAAAPHQDPAALVEREEHSMMTTGGLRPASAPAVAQSNTAEVGQNGLTATQEIDLPLLHRAQSLPFPEVAHHDGGVPAALTISEEGLKDASRCYSFIPDMEAHPQELEVSPESIADAPGDAHGKKIVASFSERHNENNVVGSEGSTTLLRGHSLDEATPRRAIEEPEVIHARRWDSPEKRIFLSCVETHTDARAPSFHDGAPAAPVAGVTLGKQQTQAGGGNEPHLAQDVDGTRVPLGQDDGSRVVPSPLGRAASGGTPDGLADTPRGHETASMHATAPHDLAPRFYGAPDTGYASSVAAAKTYPDGGPSFYGQRILMPTRVAAEVRSLDLYLSMFQGTFQKCGSLLSRALLEDDSRELTWFFHHVLPVLIFINRIWVLVLTSQHRRGVRTPASTERQLQKVRSIVFDIRIVDEAFLHAIQSKDDGAVAENRGFEPLVSQEYRKPKVRGRSQKSKKDKARVEGTRVGAAIEFAKTQLSTPWVVGLLTFASLVGLDHYGWNWYYY
ncbi:hypothetical protein BESB_016610 [Besnoitia besnoiti]|uniref:Transmembrane protein n=1 Tax=Besnoitia besnoiti TaxID=94643 RepID=A0A2A9M9J5_BESBE|nr:hypothetical protein BESB_016610 [Besnoitia besnoiti]PFH32343.1 hypothetical protein BESB_016610 [Besnoitia besnoiti]